MVGEWFEDVAVYSGSEGGCFVAKLVGGGVGRDKKSRRVHGSARARMSLVVMEAAVVSVE